MPKARRVYCEIQIFIAISGFPPAISRFHEHGPGSRRIRGGVNPLLARRHPVRWPRQHQNFINLSQLANGQNSQVAGRYWQNNESAYRGAPRAHPRIWPAPEMGVGLKTPRIWRVVVVGSRKHAARAFASSRRGKCVCTYKTRNSRKRIFGVSAPSVFVLLVPRDERPVKSRRLRSPISPR